MSYRIKRLRFRQFLKFWLVCSAVLGFIVGAASLFFALLGWSVSARLIVVELEGISAGLINLFWVPALLTFLALVISPLAYLPFNWALERSGGIVVDRDTEGVDIGNHLDAP